MKYGRTVVFLMVVVTVTSCYGGRDNGRPTEKLGREIDDSINDSLEKSSPSGKVGEAIKNLGDDIEDRG
jgi:hypothetical protein